MLDLTKYRQIRSDTIWTTAAGDKLPVKRMETSHVQNTIILLDRKQKACEELNLGDLVVQSVKAADWIELLKVELQFRQDPNSVVKKKEEVKQLEVVKQPVKELEEIIL